jgi:hypothetical protein
MSGIPGLLCVSECEDVGRLEVEVETDDFVQELNRS